MWVIIPCFMDEKTGSGEEKTRSERFGDLPKVTQLSL